MKEGSQPEAFAELALPLMRPLYNFAHWLTRDTHEAEDLVQDAYVRALKGFSSFQPGTNFRAWMFRILRNAFLTARSRKVEQVPIDEDSETFAEEATPETVLVNASRRQQLQGALERLPV